MKKITDWYVLLYIWSICFFIIGSALLFSGNFNLHGTGVINSISVAGVTIIGFGGLIIFISDILLINLAIKTKLEIDEEFSNVFVTLFILGVFFNLFAIVGVLNVKKYPKTEYNLEDDELVNKNVMMM